MRSKYPIATGLVLLSCLAGYFSAQIFAPSASESQPAEPAPNFINAEPSEHSASNEGVANRSWEENWTALSLTPDYPDLTRKRAALLEALAREDPQRALEIALSETNWLVRHELRAAALRGWGAVDPDAAATWALSEPLLGERIQCMSAVLTGAAEVPEEAIRVALAACEKDPQPAGDYGHALVNALVYRTGDFKSATHFALSAGMVDRQTYLIDSAFYQWSKYEPDRAFESLTQVEDSQSHDFAMKGVIAGASDANPQRLANYGRELSDGEDRSKILQIALIEWANDDPDATLDWISQADPHPDYDHGLSALALQPSLVSNDPASAMELTDFICDSVRRSIAKSNVFIRWARNDYDAAAEYVANLQNPDYREMFTTDLATVAAASRP